MDHRRLRAGIAGVGLCLGLGCGGAPAEPARAEVAAADEPVIVGEALPRPVAPLEVRGKVLLAEATSSFSKTRIRQSGSRRSLAFVRARGDEFLQTVIDLEDPDRLHHHYAEAVAGALLFNADPRRIMIVGLGGGTLVRFFHHFLPRATIDAVEIDPEVVRLAAAWFGVVPGPRLKVITGDGVRVLAGEGEPVDLIILDAFLDPGRPGTDPAGIPQELRGLGFLERVRGRLRPGGIAAFNIHHIQGYGEHVAAIAAVFPRLYVGKVRGFGQRIIFAVTDEGPALDAAGLAARAAELDAREAWGFSFAEVAAAIEPWASPPAATAPTPTPTPPSAQGP